MIIMERFIKSHTWLHLPYFLFLLPLFYLIHLLPEYFPLLNLSQLLNFSSFVIFGAPLMIFLIFLVAGIKRFNYAIVVFFIEFIYLFFGPIKNSLKDAGVFGRYVGLLPTLALVVFILYLFIRRQQKVLTRLISYLNCLLLFLLIYDIASLFLLRRNTLLASNSIISKPGSKTDPDIYFFIFDGYSASRTLRQKWGFDNKKIDDILKSNRFYYAYNSTSNYNSTPFSMASILNMNFIKRQSEEKIDFAEFCKMTNNIRSSFLPKYLLNRGYRIENESVFGIPGGPNPIINLSYLNDSRKLILSQTFLYRVMEDLGWQIRIPEFIVNFHRETDSVILHHQENDLIQINLQLQRVLSVHHNKMPQPVFLYAHFLLPHEPYCFDSTGKVRPTSVWNPRKKETKFEMYLDQLKFTNQIISTVTGYSGKSDGRPKVVIIQSDHGFRDFDLVQDQSLEFSNLNAIYFSDQDYRLLYDSISSVNTFRVILKKYFKEQIPLLKDSTVYLRH
jgi:hypothetical protein